MENAVGYYILSQAWDYLLSRKGYDSADSDAMAILSKLKGEVIFEESTDVDHIAFLNTCFGWKYVESVTPRELAVRS